MIARLVMPNSVTATTTIKAPPALIPKIPGEARGLLVNVCIKTPDIARDAPTVAAISALGNRIV